MHDFPCRSRNVEDLLFERGSDICHATVSLWWNRFGPLFTHHIRRQRHGGSFPPSKSVRSTGVPSAESKWRSNSDQQTPDTASSSMTKAGVCLSLDAVASIQAVKRLLVERLAFRAERWLT